MFYFGSTARVAAIILLTIATTIVPTLPAWSGNGEQIAGLTPPEAACADGRAMAAPDQSGAIYRARCATVANREESASSDQRRAGFLGFLMLFSGGAHPFGLFK